MKNLFKTGTILLLTVLIFSCAGPVADFKNTYKKLEKFNKTAEKATSDSILTTDELLELKKLYTDYDTSLDQMDEKYENNEKAREKLREYATKNAIYLDELIRQSAKVLRKMQYCKFPDDFDFSVFQ